jgi:hypothetical protein
MLEPVPDVFAVVSAAGVERAATNRRWRVCTMPDLRIEFARDTSPETVKSVADELDQLDEVDDTRPETERRILGAALLFVNVAGPVLQNVGTALPVVQKIVELLRGRDVSGATIELPDGTKISVDNASAADIERILEAAKS